MAKQIIFFLAFLPALLFGQSKKFEFGLMIGNNGQLENTLNDFYTIEFEERYILRDYNIKTTSVKYSASARYFFTDGFSARIKFGRAIRTGFVTQNSNTTYWDYDIHQTITNISPSACFSKRINKFEIITGLEIPLIQVGDCSIKSNYRNSLNSGSGAINDKFTVTTTGGFIWGINHFIGVKYFFTNCISIGTEINYGLLFADIGDKYKLEYDKGSTTSQRNNYEFVKKYKNTFFSPSEVSIGLYVQLAGVKTKVKD